MTTKIPTSRLDVADLAPRAYAAMARLEGSIELDHTIKELVAVRASQINGCALCIDMHIKDALAAGERLERLYLLDAWRESPGYDRRERAALDLCEAMTHISRDGIPEDVWERAVAVFADEELAQLVVAITAINAWNRLSITAGGQPGHYEPQAAGAAA